MDKICVYKVARKNNFKNKGTPVTLTSRRIQRKKNKLVLDVETTTANFEREL